MVNLDDELCLSFDGESLDDYDENVKIIHSRLYESTSGLLGSCSSLIGSINPENTLSTNAGDQNCSLISLSSFYLLYQFDLRRLFSSYFLEIHYLNTEILHRILANYLTVQFSLFWLTLLTTELKPFRQSYKLQDLQVPLEFYF